MLQTTLLNQCKWRENQINRKQNKNKKPKTIQPPCDMTNNTVHPQWCVWLWFFFWYWILMSSNTPQNLETPILGSKIKRLLSSRQGSASDCGWLTDVSADDATSRGKPALNCIKSQKTQRETEARRSPPRCKRRASNSKTALKKKKKSYSLTVKTNHEWRKLRFFQCYCEKPFFSTTYPRLQWRRPPQESCARVEAPYCIRVG